MRLGTTLFYLSICLICWLVCRAAIADEARSGGFVLEASQISATRTPSGDIRGQGSGNADLTFEKTRLKADLIEIDTGTGDARAIGGVTFIDPRGMLNADDLTYNFDTRTGRITKPVARRESLVVRGDLGLAEAGEFRILNASATSCDREPPDYRVTAGEISLTSDSRLTARRVSLWLGRTRLLAIPRISMKVGGRETRRSLLPRLGYEGGTGPFIGTGFPLLSGDSRYMDFTARLTLHYGFEGSMSAAMILSGTGPVALGQDVPGASMEPRLLPSLSGYNSETRGGAAPPTGKEPAAEAHQLVIFGNLGHNQRAYDIDIGRLRVSRLPEIGLRYLAPPVRSLYRSRTGWDIDAFLQGTFARGSLQLSYAHLSERPGISGVARLDVRGILPICLAAIGDRTVLYATSLARYSNYNNGESYRVLAGSLDIARVIGKGNHVAIRFVSHRTGGRTPLEADDIDIPKAVQGVLWFRAGRTLIGGEIDYDAHRGRIYDWGFTYGRTLHCLEPRISWRNRFNAIDLDIRLIGF